MIWQRFPAWKKLGNVAMKIYEDLWRSIKHVNFVKQRTHTFSSSWHTFWHVIHLALYLAFYVACYLTYTLTCYPNFIWYVFWPSFWHSICHSIWHITCYMDVGQNPVPPLNLKVDGHPLYHMISRFWPIPIMMMYDHPFELESQLSFLTMKMWGPFFQARKKAPRLRGSGRHTHDDWAHEDNASWKRFFHQWIYELDNMYWIICIVLY